MEEVWPHLSHKQLFTDQKQLKPQGYNLLHQIRKASKPSRTSELSKMFSRAKKWESRQSLQEVDSSSLSKFRNRILTNQVSRIYYRNQSTNLMPQIEVTRKRSKLLKVYLRSKKCLKRLFLKISQF